jgi:hypothetical protein
MKKLIVSLFLFSSVVILKSQTPCVSAQSWYLGGNSGTTFTNSIGSCNNRDFIIKTNDTNRVFVKSDGRIFFGKQQIAASHPHSNSFMQVDGKIGCKELVVVDPNKWSDFVFSSNYKLIPLSKLEIYYKLNKRLPDIPSEKEIKANGINVADMDALLLQKIEELTLYLVDLNKKVDLLQKENEELKTKLKN